MDEIRWRNEMSEEGRERALERHPNIKLHSIDNKTKQKHKLFLSTYWKIMGKKWGYI